MLPTGIEVSLTNAAGDMIDVTPDVSAIEWEVGSKRFNAYGIAHTPFKAALTLHNFDGKYNAYSSQLSIIGFGGRVSVLDGGNLLFAGWLDFPQQVDLTTGARFIVIPIQGALTRISQFPERLYTRLPGNVSTGAAIHRVLDDVGWPATARRVEQGETELQSFRVNTSGLLGNNRRRVNLQDALRVLAVTEVGIIYDDYQGHIVFEDRSHRRVLPPQFIEFGSGGLTATNVQIGSLRDSIINIIGGEFDEYVSAGSRGLTAQVEFPHTWTVAPYMTESYIYRWDLNPQQFVQNYESVDITAQHTIGIEEGRFVSYLVEDRKPDQLTVTYTNTTARPQDVTVNSVTGEVFQLSVGRKIGARHAESIAKYGERAEVYPANLIADLGKARNYMQYIVNKHSGVDAQGNQDALKQINITSSLNSPTNYAALRDLRISTAIKVIEPRLGLSSTDSYWVDRIKHTVTQDGQWNINIDALDTRATIQWDARTWDFGRNTVIGI